MSPSVEKQQSINLYHTAVSDATNMAGNENNSDKLDMHAVCIPSDGSQDQPNINIAAMTNTTSKEDSFIHHALESKELTLQDEKQLVIHGQTNGKSSFFHATVNCVSLLLGLGILSSPYAVERSGWMAAVVCTVLALGYWYTASLMVHCLKIHPHLANYQSIASMAFGKKGRTLIIILFYLETLGTLVGYTISMGDNLFYIFPNSQLGLPGLRGKNFMIFITSVCVLPTVWLRDLTALSFSTIWCIISSAVVVVSVFTAAIDDGIGFKYPVQFLHIKGIPVAAGMYGFAYGATGVFPAVCSSMKDPTKFPKVSAISFVIATTIQVGLGIMGAAMFGPNTKSQITLSMPSRMVTSKIVLWMTVFTPMTTFALLLSPVTTDLERLLPLGQKANPQFRHVMGTLARSLVLALITIVAMTVPYFQYIIALIGSSMTMIICIILPGAFYIKIFHGCVKLHTLLIIGLLILLAVLAGVAGTIISFQGLIDSKQSQSS